MSPRTVAAAVLIALGLVVLAYSGITYTTPGRSVAFLGLHFQTTNSHFVPPVAGALALVGGLALLTVRGRPAL